MKDFPKKHVLRGDDPGSVFASEGGLNESTSEVVHHGYQATQMGPQHCLKLQLLSQELTHFNASSITIDATPGIYEFSVVVIPVKFLR